MPRTGWSQIVAKLRYDFVALQIDFYTLNRVNRLMGIAARQIPKVFTFDRSGLSEEDVHGEWLYRSLVYTLFYSNFLTVCLIAQLHKLPPYFDYVDARLLLRAMLERYVTQKYLLMDPRRLATMYVCWRDIEAKRLHLAHQSLSATGTESAALDMDFEVGSNPWSPEREEDYQFAVQEWEKLVVPKMSATKARSWSGQSFAAMAKACGLSDLYDVTYRETSWYVHGLTAVADFFIKLGEQSNDPNYYSAKPTRYQMIGCHLQAERLFRLSFDCTDEALAWGLKSAIAAADKSTWGTWLLELIRSYT